MSTSMREQVIAVEDRVGRAIRRAGDVLTRLGWKLEEGTGWSIADNEDACYLFGLEKGMSMAVKRERPREEYQAFLERIGFDTEEAASFLDSIWLQGTAS